VGAALAHADRRTDTDTQTDGENNNNPISYHRHQSANTHLSRLTKCPILLLDFNQTCILSIDFHKSFQYQILRKIRPVGAAVAQVDRRKETDRQPKGITA